MAGETTDDGWDEKPTDQRRHPEKYVLRRVDQGEDPVYSTGTLGSYGVDVQDDQAGDNRKPPVQDPLCDSLQGLPRAPDPAHTVDEASPLGWELEMTWDWNGSAEQLSPEIVFGSA
jgi:hypothetical protein